MQGFIFIVCVIGVTCGNLQLLWRSCVCTGGARSELTSVRTFFLRCARGRGPNLGILFFRMARRPNDLFVYVNIMRESETPQVKQAGTE